MLKKNYSKTGRTCRVTFKLPAEVDADTSAICGDFNAWDGSINPMKKLKDGSFSATISLGAGKSYRFRYLLDRKAGRTTGRLILICLTSSEVKILS